MTGKILKVNAGRYLSRRSSGDGYGGVWGLLLAIPIIGIVNFVSQHIEELQLVAELLRK